MPLSPLVTTTILPPVPRQQVGPFLILGVEKNADKETVEQAWAQRLIWARKGLTKAPLEDINWAREVLSDPIRRIQADAASFNIDTTDGVLSKLGARVRSDRSAGFACRSLDVEKAPADYTPATPVPDLDQVKEALPAPKIPREVPAVEAYLRSFAGTPVDPWEFDAK